jgi:hypothetical protein
MTPDIVRTQWGYITPAALWRLKQAWEIAHAAGEPNFKIDGNIYETRFAGYLIEFCGNEGMKPEKGADDEPIFQSKPVVGRDPKPLVALLKAHLDEIGGLLIESDGTIMLHKDNKPVATIVWPDIMADVEALAAGKVS